MRAAQTLTLSDIRVQPGGPLGFRVVGTLAGPGGRSRKRVLRECSSELEATKLADRGPEHYASEFDGWRKRLKTAEKLTKPDGYKELLW